MTKPNQEHDIIIVIITIISIIITELISCFTPSLKKSQQPLTMSPSPKKRGNSSSKPKSTGIQKPVECQAPAASTATSVASSAATGSQSTAIKNSKAGTISQPTKKSRSGHSTASASHQVKTKSNQTLPTAGLGFSA